MRALLFGLKTWFVAAKGYPAQRWLLLCRFLDERAAKHEAAWAASLEYKRHYTNPDEAKRYRVPPAKDEKRRESR